VVLDDDAQPGLTGKPGAAVHTLGGHCIVVMIRDGAVDFTRPQAGDQLVALLNAGHRSVGCAAGRHRPDGVGERAF
jgi:hypothetical protein